MNPIFIILGTLGSAFAAVMTALSLINFRKPRKITLLATFMSGLIALLGLAAMLLLGGLWLEPYLGVPLFMIGLLLGYLRGAAVRLNWERDQVLGRNSILFLILWGLSLALSQLLGLLGSPLLASLGLIPVVFTSGLQAGLFGHLFLRRLIMGRKGNDRKGLQSVIGIGGGVALFLIMGITLLFVVPDMMAAAEKIGSPAANLSYQQKPADAGFDSTNPDSTSDFRPGEPPSSGKLVINCEEEYERQKEYSLNGYNFLTGNFSFDEAFTSYEIEINLTVDLSERTFTLEHEEHEGWNMHTKFPDLYDEGETLMFDTYYSGDGVLHENGWISGSYNYLHPNPNEPDTLPPDEGSNDFYGYIDDQMETVVICKLSPFEDFGDGKPNQYTADFEALMAAGKDQLISSWAYPSDCNICKVDGIRP
jgi:hypothetical protein